MSKGCLFYILFVILLFSYLEYGDKMFDVFKKDYEKAISEAVEERDFSEAHSLLKDFSKHIDELPEERSDDRRQKREQMCAYSRAERQLYTTEIVFLVEQDNSTNDRIIALISEFSGRRNLPWDSENEPYEAQMTSDELADYLISNAINLHKDELIEKFFSSGVAWSGTGAIYLLENYEDATSKLISSLSKLGSFTSPPDVKRIHTGDKLIDRTNHFNGVCLFLIDQAIMRKNKDLALQTKMLIKNDLELYSSGWGYDGKSKYKAEKKINEAIKEGVFDK